MSLLALDVWVVKSSLAVVNHTGKVFCLTYSGIPSAQRQRAVISSWSFLHLLKMILWLSSHVT